MTSSIRFGTALGVVLIAGALGACARSHGPTSASVFGAKVDTKNIGLATRAQMALADNKTGEAIDLAERAVAASPADAGFRTLLGNCYFGAGRFASAESAYRDSLTILSNQPQVVLKLALVSAAQGKNPQALAFLDAAKDVIDPADYGLALALAGQPQQGAQILQQAAQQVGADARVRQNLALAMAFNGDWTGARSVAAQDVPADQLDARIQQWMQIAKPARSSDQLAALTGIHAVASDPGQPIRLALRDAKVRLATVAAPVTESAPVEVAETSSAPAPASVAPTPVEPAPVAAAEVTPRALAAAPAVHARPAVAVIAAKAVRRDAAPRPSFSPRTTALADPRILYRRAALNTAGRTRAVVQLGAYASRASVDAAWSHASRRFGMLRGYSPVAARFDGERGTVYRLAVNGFSSSRQALDLCSSIKRAGGACFVRNLAGDAPVQLASRA